MFGCGKVSPDDGGFKGINKQRQCTDLLCLLIFIVFLAAGVAIGIVGIEMGQPESLVFGKDDNGNICGSKNTKPPNCKNGPCFYADGVKDEVTDLWAKEINEDSASQTMKINYLDDATTVAEPKTDSAAGKPLKYVIYPRLVEDLFEASKKVPPTPPMAINFFGICVDSCPQTAGWMCSMYGKGFLADLPELALPTFPLSMADKENHCPGCKTELDECKNNGIINPTMPVSMHRYKTEKCSKLLKACFYSSLPHTDTMFRCFPMYNQNVSYACDDNNDGQPDPEFPDSEGRPMNGGWQDHPFNKTQITMCGTMIKRSLSQQAAQPNFIYEQIASTVAIIGRMINDLSMSITQIIICGIVVSVVCGFLWLILLRYCARVFVWVTIVLVVILELTITVFFYLQAGLITMPDSGSTAPAPGTMSGVQMPPELQGANDTNVEMFKWGAIGMSIFLGVQMIGILGAIKKINVAAEIISEASKAVAAMSTLMVFPIFPVAMISGIFLWFIFIAVCLYSTGEINGGSLLDLAEKYKPQGSNGTAMCSNCTYMHNVTVNSTTGAWIIVQNTTTNVTGYSGSIFSGLNMTASSDFKEADWGKYLLILHLFIALWGNAFVQGFMTMTVAGAVSNWYFTVPDEGEKVQDYKFPVASACMRTVRYHLGSVAFGSGIIAAVQLVRAIMMYIDQQTKTLQDKNIILKILMKCVHCILWCFEKCIKYLTRNAYIFIAIKGSSFCGAAIDVFFCLKDNMGQMLIVAGITGYLMLIGKLVIVAASTFVCYIMVSGMEDLSSPVMPVVCTAMLAFFIASVFLNVYGIAIDTILISFCIDKKNNDGSEKKKYFMSNKMRILSGIKGDENSCYSRNDDGDNDSDVKPLGSEEESKPVEDGDDGDDKEDEVSKPEETSDSKKGHFETDLI